MESELTEDTLIDLLLDPQRRDALLAALEAAPDSGLQLHYDLTAAQCQATPEQLRAVMAALDTRDRRYERLIHDLTLHPAMPEDILLDLARQHRFVVPMAHRPGPRALLEYLAKRYRISEAITTLALSYYGAEPPETFAAFLRRHQKDWMLRANLPYATDLTAAQRAVVREIFGERIDGQQVL